MAPASVRTVLVVALTLAVAACTSSSPPDETTTTAPATSTTSTTAPAPDDPDPSPPDAPLAPPETPDPDEVAAEALTGVDGFATADAIGIFEEDALTAISFWLPEAIVSGTADATLVDGDGGAVVVVSVIPTMGWRGDPGLVPALASLDGPGTEVSDGIHVAETPGGLTVHLWSTGDGFLAASSLDRTVALRYLESRERDRVPRDVWATGDCLYIEPDEGLPWAPFPDDAVVPCDGPHNAEVLLADRTGAEPADYDEDAISYQRNRDCDRAYEEAIGPQRDHTPGLITYMPDEDEWDRGDRYLACVIELDTLDGPALVAGRITDRTDLAWSPTTGDCFDRSLAPIAVDCGGAHTYELIGEIESDAPSWPADPVDAFAAACEPLIDALPDGPAELDVFPMGLYAHAFERGERSIRCMAFARTDTGVTDVIGSFTDTWRTIRDDGIPA